MTKEHFVHFCSKMFFTRSLKNENKALTQMNDVSREPTMKNVIAMIRRSPEQLATDVLGGVWLVSLVLGALYLPAMI